jgi:hypothetical protein
LWYNPQKGARQGLGGYIVKKALFALIFLAVLSGLLWAQYRHIPRTDLNALPGEGESEIIFRPMVKMDNMSVLRWFVVFLDNAPVAQVEPGIPEKIIVKNGFTKLTILNGRLNDRGRVQNGTFQAGLPAELVVETNSNSTTVELDISTKGINRAAAAVASTEPLARSGKPAAKPAVPAPPPAAAAGGGIEDALYRAGNVLIPNLPGDTTIAIVSISSRDPGMVEFIVEELEYILVNAGGGYRIVDRKSLDAIRQERNFQMSGEVDDESAVSIGKMLGANVVITGSISGADSTRRLRIKALDAETAQILAMASERF